jgi:hypothetical protein
VYDAASPGYRGRCTAPLLVDRRTRRAVCNESSVIVRNLNAVHLPGCTPIDLFPAAAAAEIEQVNELVYDKARARHQRPSRPCMASACHYVLRGLTWQAIESGPLTCVLALIKDFSDNS